MRGKVLTLRPDCGRLHMVRRYRQTCQKPEYAPALLLILAVAAIVGLLWGLI